MTSNDRILLDQVLDQQLQSIAPTLDPARYFEIFIAEQILKDFDLSYDEIESGIVAGSGDGGIDGFYILINGELLQEDTDISDVRKNIEIAVFLLQAKTTAGFSESAMDRFVNATDDLFDLSKPLTELKTVYNEDVLKSAYRFREACQILASKFPRLIVHYYYVTKGDQPHPNVERKVQKIEAVVKKHFSSAEFHCTFLGARSLLDLARRVPTKAHELKLAENPISSTGDVAFVCLVSLKSMFAFITDAQGQIKRHIFEANVRDYQGKTQVNEQIQDTLQHPGLEDFWWLNNGITVLATRATQSGKSLTVENPEIVNGLQTSSEILYWSATCWNAFRLWQPHMETILLRQGAGFSGLLKPESRFFRFLQVQDVVDQYTSSEIYTYFRSSNTEEESRNILVRVIVPKAAESRDRIIKATNSQTAIPPASLRATDRIHRDIEQYLRPFGLYYDRRKNFYKNEGKPISRIVSISQMAQAVMAVVLRQPDTARARPSSLIKRDDEYSRLFNTTYPIAVYRASIQIIKQVEAFLAQHGDGISSADRNNIRFYVAMVACQNAVEKAEPSIAEVSSLADAPLESALLESSYRLVKSEYQRLGAGDQVAKGPDLILGIRQIIQTTYPSTYR